MISHIGLGSNLGNSKDTLHSALKALDQHPQISLKKSSSFYLSKPQGPQNQPDYLNAVAEIETSLSALDLLEQLQKIELQHGRQRKQHWGPRTLDLDLLLYEDQVLNSTRLTLPHPWMKERAFVLYPLYEISPDLLFPDGQTLADLLKDLSDEGITRLEPGNDD